MAGNHRPIYPLETSSEGSSAGSANAAVPEAPSMFGELVFPSRLQPVRPVPMPNGVPTAPGVTAHPARLVPNAGAPAITHQMLQQAQSQMMSQWRAQTQVQQNGVAPPFHPETSLSESQAKRGQSNASLQHGQQPSMLERAGGSARTVSVSAGTTATASQIPLPTMTRTFLHSAVVPPQSNSAKTLSAPIPQHQRVVQDAPNHPPSNLSSSLPIFKMSAAIPPYKPEMTEEQFLASLSKFLIAINLPLKKIPEFQGRPVQMHRLFQIVTTLGGFQKVTEASRWNAVAASLQYWHNNPELLHQLRSFYYTLFYAYEQYFFHKVPLDKIFWPHQAITQAAAAQKQASALSSSSSSATAAAGAAPSSSNNRLPVHSLPSSKQETGSINTAQGLTPLKRTDSPLYKEQASPGAPLGPADEPKPKKPSAPLRHALESLHSLSSTVRSMPTVGKISLEEIALMLASKLPAVQIAALGILEQLSWDSNLKLPSQAAMNSLIEALVDVFGEQIRAQAKTRARPTRVREGTRPFDYLASKADETTADLTQRLGQNPSVLESIVNILRSWALRPESALLIAQSPTLIWKLLLPSLSKSEIWTLLSLECYKGLWLVLMQVSSLIQLRSVATLEAVIVIALEEVRSCTAVQRGHSYRLLSTVTRDTHDTESIKRAIITFIQTSNSFWKKMPSHCFMLIEFLCRVVSNSVAEGVFDLHPTLSRNHQLTATLLRLLEVLWDVVEVFAVIVVFLSSLVSSLMHLESFQKTTDYTKWMAMVLHNVNFGLPDGGYLEVSLLTILHTLRRLDTSCCSSWCHTVAPQLVLQVDRVRKLWTYPNVGPQLGKSPLLTQPINSITSQPYLVLIRMMAILGHMTSTQPAKNLGLGHSEAERLVEWMTTPAPTSACEELLRSSEMVAITESLLASVALPNKSP